jgi:16S rRNA processing protein RimM
MNKNLILIGKVLKTHGIKGNLSAIFYSENAFSQYKNFFDKNGREIELKIVSKPVENKENDAISSNFKTIININKTDNCNDAIKFVNSEIFIKKSDIEKNDDEFLISDLIGMKVFDFNEKNKNLGVIEDVHDFGGGTIIEINFDKKYTEFGPFKMMPFDDETFPEITENAIYLNFIPKNISNIDDENNDEELSDEDIQLLSEEFEKYMLKKKKV